MRYNWDINEIRNDIKRMEELVKNNQEDELILDHVKQYHMMLSCVIKGENSTKNRGSQKVSKATKDYLLSAEPGTLIAFKRSSSKDIAMSGKLVSIEGEKVTIESKKGTLFKINQENVIWVKTGERWPRWVFSMFNKPKEVESDNAIS